MCYAWFHGLAGWERDHPQLGTVAVHVLIDQITRAARIKWLPAFLIFQYNQLFGSGQCERCDSHHTRKQETVRYLYVLAHHSPYIIRIRS